MHITMYVGQHCQLAELVAVHCVRFAEGLLGGFSVQNCGLERVPAALGAASRLRQLRLSDSHGYMYFRMRDLETLSSMCSLTFLDLTQAGLCDACGGLCWRSDLLVLIDHHHAEC
jgi:hypothetical protein